MCDEYLNALKQVVTNLGRVNVPLAMLESIGVPVYNATGIIRQIIEDELRKRDEAAKAENAPETQEAPLEIVPEPAEVNE